MTHISDFAFSGCSALALTSLPKELLQIGWSSFEDCSELALTSLPEKLTVIENRAFRGCRKLALTGLPETLKGISIGQDSFQGCPLVSMFL